MTRGNGKNKKNNQGGRGVPQGRNGRGRGGRDRMVAGVNPAQYINPWSPNLYKVPDEFSGKSIPYRMRLASSLNPDATYVTAVKKYLPRITLNAYESAVVNASGSISGWGSATTLSDLSSDFSRYRIVSWGVRATVTSAPNDSAGRLVIQTTVDDAAAASVTTYVNNTFRRDEYYIYPGMQIVWMSEPLHNRAREFRPISESGAVYSYDWTYPIFWLMESNTTTRVQLDIVYNIEALPEVTTILGRVATIAAPENQGFMQSVRETFRSLPSTFNAANQDVRGSHWIMEALTNTAQTVARRAAGGIADYAMQRMIGNSTIGPTVPLLTYPGFGGS